MPEQTVVVRHDHKVNRDIFLCYEAIGDASADPLILIPGLTTQMIAWRDDMCQLFVDKGFYVIRIDNRDYGNSIHLDHCPVPNPLKLKAKSYFKSIPDEAVPYTLKDMAEDVVGLMDKLSIPKATIMGMSMGGMISQELAIHWPERVRALVLVMTTAGGSTATDASIWTQLKLLKKAPQDEEGIIKHGVWILSQINGKKHFDEKAIEEYVRACYKRSTYKVGGGRQIAAILQANRDGRSHNLGKIKCPVSIVHGQDDVLIPVANAHTLAKAIPGSEVFIVPEMGHDLAPHSWPSWVEAVVKATGKAKEQGAKEPKEEAAVVSPVVVPTESVPREVSVEQAGKEVAKDAEKEADAAIDEDVMSM